MLEYVNVKIQPNNITKKVKKGIKLIDIIHDSHLHINAVCASRGNCGKCKVKIISGKTSDLTENEKKLLTQEEIQQNIVLACEKNIIEDVVVHLMSEDKDLTSDKGCISTNNKNNKKINPIISKKFHKLDKPSLTDQDADINRITRIFHNNIEVDISLIPKIHNILKESDYNITTSIIENKLINIEKGNTTDKNYAIAIDLGTTSVGGYLIDINKGKVVSSYSYTNLQKSYGADILSRINYSIESEENLQELKRLSIETIDIIINEILNKSSVDKDYVNLVVILGNTTMSHLVLGVEPIGIAKAPFTPVFKDTVKGRVHYLGLSSLNKESKFVILPNIGGYVGSDTLGAIISCDILNKKGNNLVIDIGTNCELALKTKEKVLVCSTSAGPAFEGANMTYGMRAESGAIYSCNIKDDIYIKTVDNKDAIGICGSGYIDIVAKLVENKIVKKQGRVLSPDKINNAISDKVKSKIIKDKNMNKIILSTSKNEVSINQEDISNLQLAKGAVRAGIEILMKEAGITYLDKIYLCGAFGSNLNKESLKIIKMIPNIDNEKIEVVGNAAGSGAIDIILYKEIYEELTKISSSIMHIELANHKEFQSEFTKGMMF